jgi:RHS repeat-associated protein
VWIGKENDVESCLGDFGARKYDPELGRFTSVDPLWEKYLGLQPYQYAANSPIRYYDNNGKWISAASSTAELAIRNSVPSEFRSSIQFKDGILNTEMVKEAAAGQDVNSNIAILSRLAENPNTIEVSVEKETISYRNKQGTEQTITFSETEKQTPGRTLLGITLPPRSDQNTSGASDGTAFSTSGNIQVIVRDSQSSPANNMAGKTLAHELYGHARFILLCRYGLATSATHGNQQVEQAIKRAEKESVK